VRLPVKFLVAPLLVIVGLVVLMDIVVMPAVTRHGREFPAPNLVGRSIETVRPSLDSVGALLEIAEQRHSPDHAEGTIIEQRPAAGRPIKGGRTLKVVVSRGSELLDVPRLRGFSVRQAELILGEAGFAIGGRAPAQDPDVPVGTVAGTIPSAGARLPRESVVNLLVNESEPEWAWCPNLVGKNIEEARTILRERGLMLGRVERQLDSRLLPGTVVSQSISPGGEVRVGTEIGLVISRDR